MGRYVIHNGVITWLSAEYDGDDLYGTHAMGQAVQTGVPVNSPGAGSSTDALLPAPLPSQDSAVTTVPHAQANVVGNTEADPLEPTYHTGYSGGWLQHLPELSFTEGFQTRRKGESCTT